MKRLQLAFIIVTAIATFNVALSLLATTAGAEKLLTFFIFTSLLIFDLYAIVEIVRKDDKEK